MRRATLLALVIVVVGVGQVPGHARADVDPPWAEGVPAENRSQANTLLAEGNQLFAQQAHAPALEKYRAALALWDHPMIHFNIAVTLIRLDRVVEAAGDLDAALRFGPTPFNSDLYQQAMDYQKLVGGRVGDIEVACDQKEAHVLLDGKPWFSGTGKKKLRVLAGEHLIVVEGQGFMTISRRVIVIGGKAWSEKLTLMPIESVIKVEYKTARWIPWSITGLGAAIGVGGLGFWFAARSQADKFRADYAVACPFGCHADLSDQPLLADARDGARLKDRIGVTMMVAGGVLTAAGAVWAGFFNGPKRVLPIIEAVPTSGGISASAGWRF